MNIIIKSAIIIDSKSQFHNKRKDVLIEKGIITKIASNIKNNNEYKELTLKSGTLPKVIIPIDYYMTWPT